MNNINLQPNLAQDMPTDREVRAGVAMSLWMDSESK